MPVDPHLPAEQAEFERDRHSGVFVRVIPPGPDLWDDSPDQQASGHRWWRRLGWLTLLVLIVINGGLVVVLWQGHQAVSQLEAGPKQAIAAAARPQLGLAPVHPAPGLRRAETILVIGADYRAGDTSSRSDTMLLVRVEPKSDRVSMLSLPRDMRVPIPGYGYNKLNAAYAYGGVALTIRTIREWLGIPIDHFATLDFGGFTHLVNDLGGVYLPIDARYDHTSGPGIEDWASIHLNPGYQLLNGSQALSWVRFRHLDSDFYRTARQQIFLREVGRQLRAEASNPLVLRRVLFDLAKATTSDLNNLSQLLSLADTLRRIPSDRIERTTLAGSSVVLDGIDYLQASQGQIQAALDAWAGQRLPASGSALTSIGSGSLTTDGPSQPLLNGPTSVVASSGAVADQFGPVVTCAPSALPAGFIWPDDPGQSYQLAGHPAAAIYATEGSGISLLWDWTSWQHPPILSDPSRTIIVNGQHYQLFFEGSHLRMVAWHRGGSVIWITNTLLNAVTNRDLLALATSCQPR
jgi:LCP family protein required for cell wall assembly